MMRGRAKTLVVDATVVALMLPLASAMGQADVPPVLHADSSSVYFPSLMAAARVGGRAHASATIDSTGRIAEGSLRVEGSHDLFANAAKTAMRKFSYDAARHDGHAIADRIDVEFEFHLPNSPVVPTIALWRVERDTGGYRIVTGWDSVRRARPAPILSDDETKAAHQAIIRAARRDSLSDKEPLSVDFKKFEFWTSDILGAEVQTYDYGPPPHAVFGGGGRNLWCQAIRSGPRSPWVARCEMLSVWVS